jgi:hypothetical protein
MPSKAPGVENPRRAIAFKNGRIEIKHSKIRLILA